MLVDTQFLNVMGGHIFKCPKNLTPGHLARAFCSQIILYLSLRKKNLKAFIVSLILNLNWKQFICVVFSHFHMLKLKKAQNKTMRLHCNFLNNVYFNYQSFTLQSIKSRSLPL